MLQAYELLNDIKEKTNALDGVCFGAIICMLMEEWCKANDSDVVEFSNKNAGLIKEVNEEEGRYE